MAEEKLEFAVNEEWQQYYRENSWAVFIPEFAKNARGEEFMRRAGGSVIYKIVKEDEKGNQNYVCADCGSEIMGERVAHPIWDGPSRCSGSGQCHYENVPYCPKCEQKPNFHGIPIEVGEKAGMSIAD